MDTITTITSVARIRATAHQERPESVLPCAGPGAGAPPGADGLGAMDGLDVVVLLAVEVGVIEGEAEGIEAEPLMTAPHAEMFAVPFGNENVISLPDGNKGLVILAARITESVASTQLPVKELAR